MFSDRLSEFIATIGETPTSIEPKIGVSKGAIYKPVRNRKTIGIEILAKILTAYPRLNLEWLISGNGTMWKNHFAVVHNHTDNASEDSDAAYHYLAGSRIPVSLINEASAISWDGGQKEGEDVVKSVFFLPPGLLRKGSEYAAFPISGPQMEPTIPVNSLVVAELVKPKDYARIENGSVFVVITNEVVLIRRITNRIRERNTLYACSDNREYTSCEIPIETTTSLWRARALFSHKFTSESHRLFDLYQDLEERIKSLEKKDKPL